MVKLKRVKKFDVIISFFLLVLFLALPSLRSQTLFFLLRILKREKHIQMHNKKKPPSFSSTIVNIYTVAKIESFDVKSHLILHFEVTY